MNAVLEWARYVAADPEARLDNLPCRGITLRPIAIYGAPHLDLETAHENKATIFLAKGIGQNKEDIANPPSAEHDYFQIFFEMPGRGDVAIEIAARGKETHEKDSEQQCWVSAYDKKHAAGIELGHFEVHDPKQLLTELGDYLGWQKAFVDLLTPIASKVNASETSRLTAPNPLGK